MPTTNLTLAILSQPSRPALLQSGATVATGVNTAGTVRVNNLANLEALG